MSEATLSCYRLQQISGPEEESYYREVQSSPLYQTSCYRSYTFGDDTQVDRNTNDHGQVAGLSVGFCDNRGLFTLLNLDDHSSCVYYMTVAQYEREKSTQRFKTVKFSPNATKWSQFQFLPRMGLLFVHMHSNKLFYVRLPRQAQKNPLYSDDDDDEHHDDDDHGNDVRDSDESYDGEVFVLNKMDVSIVHVEVSRTGSKISCVSVSGELHILDIDTTVKQECPIVKSVFRLDISTLLRSGESSEEINYRVYFITEDMIAIACDSGRFFIYDLEQKSTLKELIIEASIVHIAYIIDLEPYDTRSNYSCDLLVGNMMGTMFRIRVSPENIEMMDIIYSNLATGEISEITWLHHFTSNMESSVVTPESEDVTFVVCTKGKSNTIQFYNSEGQLYLHYGPLAQPIVYCTITTSQDTSGHYIKNLIVVFNDGSGAAWTVSKILSDGAWEHPIDTVDTSNQGQSEHEIIQFEDYVSEGDEFDTDSVHSDALDKDTMDRVDNVLHADDEDDDDSEIEPREFNHEFHRNFNNGEPIDQEVELLDDEEMMFEDGEAPQNLIPQPEPYPKHSKPKADQRERMFQKKPTVTIVSKPEKIEFDSSLAPKEFNYGRSDKVHDTIAKFRPRSDAPPTFTANPPTVPTAPIAPTAVLNSTRLLRDKLEKMKQTKFNPKENIIPQSKFELNPKTPETTQILNYEPEDRMFSNLPQVKVDIEDQTGSAFVIRKRSPSKRKQQRRLETKEQLVTNSTPILVEDHENSSGGGDEEIEMFKRKKKVGKQVDQHYLDQLEKKRPMLDDMKRFYNLEQEILIHHSFVFKPKRKARYHEENSAVPSFIQHYLKHNPYL